MKHKKYPVIDGKNANSLAAEVARFVQNSCGMDVKQWEENGRFFIVPVTKHQLTQSLIGQDKRFGICITEVDGSIDVAIGMGAWATRAVLLAGSAAVSVATLPVAVYAVSRGAKAQKDIINAVWKHIDVYMR